VSAGWKPSTPDEQRLLGWLGANGSSSFFLDACQPINDCHAATERGGSRAKGRSVRLGSYPRQFDAFCAVLPAVAAGPRGAVPTLTEHQGCVHERYAARRTRHLYRAHSHSHPPPCRHRRCRRRSRRRCRHPSPRGRRPPSPGRGVAVGVGGRSLRPHRQEGAADPPPPRGGRPAGFTEHLKGTCRINQRGWRPPWIAVAAQVHAYRATQTVQVPAPMDAWRQLLSGLHRSQKDIPVLIHSSVQSAVASCVIRTASTFGSGLPMAIPDRPANAHVNLTQSCTLYHKRRDSRHCAVELHRGWDTSAISGHVGPHRARKSACAASCRQAIFPPIISMAVLPGRRGPVVVQHQKRPDMTNSA